MKRAVPFVAILLAITAGGAALRLVDLGNRPMHWDEANQAWKFGDLLERGRYEYDPRDHHGPSLNYLTLPIAWLVSANDLAQVTETHLRLLPAIFGILLVGLVWLLRDQLGRPAAVWAAVLTAVSPAMVFYSRYYIQEMLLVGFTFGAMAALWRGSRATGTGRWPWLVLLGLCIGMMHASKETCVISWCAMGLAAMATKKGSELFFAKKIVLTPFFVAAGVSALFFSSFFSHPQGVVDSVTAYSVYFDRASGQGSAGWHDQPWYHYFELLFWWQRGDGPVWTEASIAVLALVGLLAAAVGKGMQPATVPFARFAAIYTLAMIAVYSAISYKTPWCVLGFLHGMILLAGVGAAVLIGLSRNYVWKGIMTALLIAAAGHLAWQAHRAAFVEYADPNNPYVYEHAPEDVPRLAASVRRIAAVHPDKEAMPIHVICPDGEWPLPWYFRGFSRLGCSPSVPNSPPAPVIITQRNLHDPVPEYFHAEPAPGKRHGFVPVVPNTEERGWRLHPKVPLLLHVRRDLWREFVARQDPAHADLLADATGDVARLVQEIKRIAAVDPDGQAMHVQVICPESGFWPLPWYLRDMPRVEFSAETPAGLPAPLIIAPPQMEDTVLEYAFTRPPPGQRPLYTTLRTEDAGIWELYPGRFVTGYLQLDLFNTYQAGQRE